MEASSLVTCIRQTSPGSLPALTSFRNYGTLFFNSHVLKEAGVYL